MPPEYILHDSDRLVDERVRMRRHQARAEQALVRRGRRRKRRIDIHARVIELLRDRQRLDGLVRVDRNDRHNIAVRRAHLDFVLLQPAS